MNDTEPVVGRRVRTRRALALAVLFICAAFGIWFATRPQPAALFEQALAASERDPATGERLLRKALEAADGSFPDAELALCRVIAIKGGWDEAAQRFTALDLTECRCDLLLAFGRTALENKQQTLGLMALEAAGKGKTQASVEALGLLMAQYTQWGQPRELFDVARELLRLDPDNFRCWGTLIEILRATERENESLDAIREALANDPPEEYRRVFQYELFQNLIEQGETAKAAQALVDLRALEGDSIRVRAAQSDIYRLQGEFDKALLLASDLIADLGIAGIASFKRGVIYLDLRRFDDAARDLERAVATQPHNENAHFKLSEAYRGLGRDKLALQHWEESSRILEKRKRINQLLTQRSQERQDFTGHDELVELYRALDEHDAARYFEQTGSRLAPR